MSQPPVLPIVGPADPLTWTYYGSRVSLRSRRTRRRPHYMISALTY